MVPGRWWSRRLPLTVNGKLMQALPAPEYPDADQYRPPADGSRRSWPGIYAEVLGVERRCR